MKHNKKRTWKRYKVTYWRGGNLHSEIVRADSAADARWQVSPGSELNILSVELLPD